VNEFVKIWTERARRAAPLAARIAVGGLLAAAGYMKLLTPVEERASAFDVYQMLSPALALWAGRVLPWVELVTGLYVILGIYLRSASAVAAFLYAGFIVFLTQALVRRLSLEDCGCFGRLGPSLKPSQTLLLDVVLLALAVWMYRNPSGPRLDKFTFPLQNLKRILTSNK
jgi:uncharacterized membrane protein YphA (DoxX/SURF4 family)